MIIYRIILLCYLLKLKKRMFIRNAFMEKDLLDASNVEVKVFAFIPFQKKRVESVVVHRFVITESIEESVRYVKGHIFVSIRKENIAAIA